MNSQKLKEQIETWRRDLIDFSRRNKLLSTSERGASINLVEPSPSEILTGILTSSMWTIHLPGLGDKSDSDETLELFENLESNDGVRAPNEVMAAQNDREKLLSTLRTLRRRSEQEFLDKGLAVLYLAIGSLEWYDNTEEWNSPIILVPIQIIKLEQGGFGFKLNEEEDVVINPALIEKLRDLFAIEINFTFDEENPLKALSEFETIAKNYDKWSVHEAARVGTYSFAKEVMYRDLGANADAVAESEIVQALAFGSESEADFSFESLNDADLDKTYPPTALHSILDADSTQRKAIVAAKEGESFVIDGPPGTGKSQTIANIIAELMSQRKSILFVSEKAAALEVVQSRLEGSGLGSFVLPLHSQKVTRKAFASMLLKAANERTRAGTALSTADVTRYETSQKKLSAYVASLNKKRDPLCRSLFEVMGEHAMLDDFPVAPLPTESIDQSLTPTMLNEIQDSVEQLSYVWDVVVTPDQVVWRGLNNPEKTNSERPKLTSELDVLATSSETGIQLGTEAAEDSGLPKPETLKDLENLIALAELTDEAPLVPAQWISNQNFGNLLNSIDGFCETLKLLRESKDALQNKCSEWESLDGAVGNEIQSIQSSLSNLDHADLILSENIKSFFTSVDKYESDIDAIEESLSDLKSLEERFGDPEEKATFERIQVMSSAAELANAAHRPESLWFTALGIQAAMDVIASVQPVVEDYWARAQALDSFFSPEIRDFPIENIFDPVSNQPVLGTLNGKGRANKKALHPFIKGGKLTKEVKEQLPAVKELQDLQSKIDSDEKSLDALGTFYFKGIKTDFSILTESIEIARKAVLKLTNSSPEQLASALGRAALDVTETFERGQKISLTSQAFISSTSKLRLQLSSGSKKTFKETILVSEAVKEAREIIGSWNKLRPLLMEIQEKFDTDITIELAIEIAIERTAFETSLKQFEETGADNEKLLGRLYSGFDTEIQIIRKAIHWTKELRGHLYEVPSERLAKRLLEVGVTSSPELEHAVDSIQMVVERLSSIFLPARAVELKDEIEVGLESIVNLATSLSDTMDQISDQIVFREESDRLIEMGLGDLLSFLKSQQIDSDQLISVTTKAVLAAWIESVLNDEKTQLTPLEKMTRDAAVEKFRELDESLRKHAIAEVVTIANNARPKTIIGPMGLIQREAAKKNRHMRIPALIERTKEIVTDIAPCFMMSPLSVSTFLPPDLVFDVVIFDEASQIMTSNAINCVYRGKQLIVAGDDKQMPPSRGFDVALSGSDSDEYDEEEIEDFESLLHQANSGGFENLGLRWHYRSRHESLITYSNLSFYDGKLVTYPSPTQLSEDLGVSFVHVPDGVYMRSGRRSNPIEAAKVVERVLYHADNNPGLTLGVVAFSLAQADEIENALELALKERPDLEEYFTSDRLDGFFVKNLENVQGDERDVIIFSVGYGYDENHKLTMNFGPINKDKGWRRLNVAFTRARYRVELISSITAADFAATQNESIVHLKRYFDYAERGIAAFAFDSDTEEGVAESPFEEAVLERIRSWGYEVQPQVGQAGYRIDMGVRDPNRPGAFILGIECDGAMYHSSQVARDRDRLRQEVLEGLGWNLYRIWGPTWYRSRASAEKDLQRAIEDAVANGDQNPSLVPNRKRRTKKESPTDEVVVKVSEVELSDTPDWVEPYFNVMTPRWPRLTPAKNLQNIHVDELIIKALEFEGPVGRVVIQKRFANASQQSRTKKVQSLVDERLRILEADGHILRSKPDIFSLPNQDLYRVRFPDSRDHLTLRGPSEMPQTELVAAIYNIVAEVGTISRDELSGVLVRNLFGLQRITIQWRDRIDTVLDSLDGLWLTIEGDFVSRLSTWSANDPKPWLAK